MDFNTFNNIYFIGIGGIGMSALARYFKAIGKQVAGYDRTPSHITRALLSEGIAVHYTDSANKIPETFRNKKQTGIVYTPAVANENRQLNFFKNNGFSLKKRAIVLGDIANTKNTIAVAGTHAKTTISTLIAHILHSSQTGASAILGGIAKNYNSNLLLSEKSNYMVVEADEYDRSFLQLAPETAIITSIDADHLDIYGTQEQLIAAFRQFVDKIRKNGKLIAKQNIKLHPTRDDIHTYRYALCDGQADFYASNIRLENGKYHFHVMTHKNKLIRDLTTCMPGLINVENTVATVATAVLCGVSESEIRNALNRFAGIKRRFDIQAKDAKNNMIYIDDYAHHPTELSAVINSAKALYPKQKITGIFQPHLYSRTRDFATEFAKSLDLLDELILLDIYPARERPINGISSEIIFKKVKNNNKILLEKKELLKYLEDKDFNILMTLGAGDIDRLVTPIRSMIKQRAMQTNIE